MIETLFFKCYYAYLKGDLPQTRMYYEILKDEFKIKGSTSSLRPDQLLELKKIKNSIETGSIALNTWVDEMHPQGPYMQPIAGFPQDDLVRNIVHYFIQLEDILQDKLYLYNLEHPCDPYGAVDMVFMGKGTVYPLEVKKDQGRHDLIGQIYKYDLYHKFRLHYKHYEKVQSVTICSSYEPYTLKSLKQLGVKTILYSIGADGLTMTSL